MALRIDFHSHVLPGLDHGSRDLETSLDQLAMVHENRTDILVASSHFYPHRMNLSGFLQRREAAVKELLDNLGEDCPRIVLGTETACYPGLEDMDGLEQLCIAGTNVLLLEMPMTTWKDAHLETVDAITARGIDVVLAHIDRFSESDVERVMQLDVKAQINASSLCSFFKRRKLKHWFHEGRVWALGSDLHGADRGGYDHFPKALSKLGVETVADVMARSASLLENAIYLN